MSAASSGFSNRLVAGACPLTDFVANRMFCRKKIHPNASRHSIPPMLAPTPIPAFAPVDNEECEVMRGGAEDV